jgi:hypothetical protein
MVELQKYLFENGYNYEKIRIGENYFLIVSEQSIGCTIKTSRKPWIEYETGSGQIDCREQKENL